MITASTKRRAIVHIGLEKTGSTSLQHALDQDRVALLESGYLLPMSAGRFNHTKLVVACLENGTIDNIKAHQMARNAITEAELRKKFFSRFAAELKRKEPWHTLIVTSELISSRLYRRSEVDRLVSLLQRYVDEIVVVLFLRRQDRLAVSRFSSILRAGHAGFDDLFGDFSGEVFYRGNQGEKFSDRRQLFDYDAITGRFENRDGVQLRVFSYGQHPAELDPVKALYEIMEVSASSWRGNSLNLNTGMSVRAQYIIAELNKNHDVTFKSGLRNQPYRDLLREIETTITGRRRLVSRAEAEDYLSQFSKSNDQVRRKYFPDRTCLFDDEFAEYPAKVSYGDLANDLSDVLRHYREKAEPIPRREELRPIVERKLKLLMAHLRVKPR